MKILAPILLAAMLFDAQAQTPAPREPQPVIALLAAIGDRIEVVRQRQQVGSSIAPFTRKTLQVPDQALNFAVLRGLDRAVADDEPQAKRVLLRWTMPSELADRIENATGQDRQTIVLDAVLPYLRSLPQRQGWDRVEVLVPAYTYAPVKGMGTRLSGIGIYIQPLKNQYIALGDVTDNDVSFSEADGDFRTINPNTGETAKSSIFVAPYMYFERLTYDAKTLELIKRQRFFSNTKYADPQSTATDVSDQMSTTQLLGKLVETVESSAYKSIHQTTGDVSVTTPVPIYPIAASAAASSSR